MNKGNVLARMLDHKEAIISHLINEKLYQKAERSERRDDCAAYSRM